MPRPAITSRDDLTGAVMRVVCEQGLDAVSIRAVAREAGVSIGTVQYHFTTKDDLLLAAYQRVIDQFTIRARRAAEGNPSPRVYIRSLLDELLPLDDLRAAELRAAVAFTARSVYSPRLTELYTLGYRALVDAVANALRRAIEGGEAASDVDPQRDATQAVALADGLAWHLLCAPSALACDSAEAALDAYLALLLPQPRPEERATCQEQSS